MLQYTQEECLLSKEVSLISASYKIQMKRGMKALTKTEREETNAAFQAEKWKAKEQEKKKEAEELRNNITQKGLLHYNQKRRERLLNEAEELKYSRENIAKLREFTADNWNADTVNYETIDAFYAVEGFVKENAPGWGKNIFHKIGELFGDNED